MKDDKMELNTKHKTYVEEDADLVTEIETKRIIETQIESCLKGMVRCAEQNISDFFQRTDELFLLWAKVEDCSFVEAVKSFGINYYDFNNKNYKKVRNQIVNKYKEYFEGMF